MAAKAHSRPYSQVFIDSPRYNSKNLYKKRRKAMLDALDSFCVIAGIPAEPGSEEAYVQTWNKFIQEPAFLYLTGINQSGCYLHGVDAFGDEHHLELAQAAGEVVYKPVGDKLEREEDHEAP